MTVLSCFEPLYLVDFPVEGLRIKVMLSMDAANLKEEVSLMWFGPVSAKNPLGCRSSPGGHEQT